MNTVIRNALPVPLLVVPLVGGFSGLLFGIIFGSVSTRRAGTVFAMISLGSRGTRSLELADPARILRRRGRGEYRPHQAAARVRSQFRPANPGLLPDRGVVPSLHGNDVRAHAHSLRPHVQRRARESRTRAVRRLQSTHVALHRLLAGRPVRRHRRRSRGHQFRAGQFRGGRRGPIRSGAARRLYRRHWKFHRTSDRRHPRHLARGDAKRRDRRLAALFRSLIHRHGDVRAERHRRPADDARATVAGARLWIDAAARAGYLLALVPALATARRASSSSSR
jgi:hypothetical protein